MYREHEQNQLLCVNQFVHLVVGSRNLFSDAKVSEKSSRGGECCGVMGDIGWIFGSNGMDTVRRFYDRKSAGLMVICRKETVV